MFDILTTTKVVEGTVVFIKDDVILLMIINQSGNTELSTGEQAENELKDWGISKEDETWDRNFDEGAEIYSDNDITAYFLES